MSDSQPGSPPSPASTAPSEVSRSPLIKRDAEAHSVTVFTMDEVRQKRLVVIDGKVYDVKQWVAEGRHPGGDVILKCLGRDVTSLFREVGRLDPASTLDEAEADFIKLERHVRQLGYYRQKWSYYAGRMAIVLAFLFCAIVSVLNGWVLAGAICLGMFWQQGAFIAHDACHRGCGDGDGRGPSWTGWFVGSLMFGISAGMWSEEHAAHHCFPRRPREDPQFNYLPTFLITQKELPYSNRWEELVARLIVPVQHFVVAPLAMTIGRFNFYIISILFSCRRAIQYHIKVESIPMHCAPVADLMGISLFWCWYGLFLYYLVPSEGRLLFLLLSNCTAGMLHVQLLVSHLAVDCYHSHEEPAWFRLQCNTSRNVDTWAHWFWGGLDYQIEHHLFPRLPRHSLSLVQPMVQELCRKHNVPYRSEGEIKTLAMIFDDLRSLASIVADPV